MTEWNDDRCPLCDEPPPTYRGECGGSFIAPCPYPDGLPNPGNPVEDAEADDTPPMLYADGDR